MVQIYKKNSELSPIKSTTILNGDIVCCITPIRRGYTKGDRYNGFFKKCWARIHCLKNTVLLVLLFFYLYVKKCHFSKKCYFSKKNTWIPLIFEHILVVFYSYTRGNGIFLLG